MKPILKNILIGIIFLNSCGKSELGDYDFLNYSIALDKFSSLDKAYNYKAKLNNEVADSIFIRNVSDGYMVLYGNYSSSFIAGKRAFELFNKKLLHKYKIVKQGKLVTDQFANVLFIANYSGRPSLYNFNLLNREFKLIWSRWGRKVLSINRSNDRSSAFFITALSIKSNYSIPLINDARLYFYNADENNIEEVSFLGDGIQTYSYWESSDTFKVNFTYADSLKPQVIIQKILSFDKSGKMLKQTYRKFDLIKDGFPKPPQIKPTVVSPRGRFQIRSIKENDKSYIYIRDVIKNAELLLIDYRGILNSIVWTDDEKYAFITIASNNNYDMFIVDTENMRIRKKFTNLPDDNLLVHGNFLFFDEQINGFKNITIYDYVKNVVFYRIESLGNCSINSLVN